MYFFLTLEASLPQQLSFLLHLDSLPEASFIARSIVSVLRMVNVDATTIPAE